MSVSTAQKRATAKFEAANYDKILVRFKKGTKQRIQEAAAGSVNGFIIAAVNEKLETIEKKETDPGGKIVFH